MLEQLKSVIAVFATLVVSYYGCAVLITILLEICAQVTGRRARVLRAHLVRLFGNDLATSILNNPLVRPVKYQQKRTTWRRASSSMRRLLKATDNPVAYIAPRDFALVLMYEAFESSPEKHVHGGRLIVVKDDSTVPKAASELLGTLLQDTHDNPAHVQERLEGWFKRDQEQLSGSYGARSRVWAVVLGTLVAFFVGLDTLKLAVGDAWHAGLPWMPASLATSLSQAAHGGYWNRVLLSIPGSLLSGLMISQGASFWFDIVTRVANLRNEGAKPS